MKRIGNIFDAVVEPTNLELAFWKASLGKRSRDDQRLYQANLDEELMRLREGLIDGSYPVGNYRRFVVCEPKERTICAAAFRERVLHHALMNVLEPHIERWLIFDSYACRVGKGQLRAVRRAQQFAKRYRWFMKCDIRKFFDSIPHEGLDDMLNRKLKDQQIIDWLMRIVATYETTPGRGLPIGNLTSQHLANLYLDQIDRFASGPRGVRTQPRTHFGYVRYMDDFVYWSDDKTALLELRKRLAEFVEARLGLSLKQTPYVNRTAKGMDFLGMRVFPQTIRANRASLGRFKRKVRIYDWELAQGYWDESTYQQRMAALTAFLQEADTLGWRREFLRKEEGRRREASGSNRVIRGGSWNNNAQNCRSANRNNNPSNNNNNNGFRLCCSAAPQEGELPAVPAAVLFPQRSARGADPTGTKRPRPAAAGSAARRERRGRGFTGWRRQQRVERLSNAIDCNRWQSKQGAVRHD